MEAGWRAQLKNGNGKTRKDIQERRWDAHNQPFLEGEKGMIQSLQEEKRCNEKVQGKLTEKKQFDQQSKEYD